jgi:hypothetical protein
MYIYKRSSLGSNKVKVFINNQGWWTCIVHNPRANLNIYVQSEFDLRKLKRKLRKAGWIK